jgi:hypothetical protein
LLIILAGLYSLTTRTALLTKKEALGHELKETDQFMVRELCTLKKRTHKLHDSTDCNYRFHGLQYLIHEMMYPYSSLMYMYMGYPFYLSNENV